MRVILDANVLISYLLDPESRRTITKVVEVCYGEDVGLLTPIELLQEVRESIGKYEYLSKRITAGNIDQFERILAEVSQTPPKLDESFPEYTADPDDDYLIAYAVVHEVDYLVTGDPHLLVLNQVDNTKVVTPAQFVAIIDR